MRSILCALLLSTLVFAPLVGAGPVHPIDYQPPECLPEDCLGGGGSEATECVGDCPPLGTCISSCSFSYQPVSHDQWCETPYVCHYGAEYHIQATGWLNMQHMTCTYTRTARDYGEKETTTFDVSASGGRCKVLPGGFVSPRPYCGTKVTEVITASASAPNGYSKSDRREISFTLC